MKNLIVAAVALLVILLSSLSFSQDTGYVQEYLDGHRATFNSQNHPKARGVCFTITYPSSWASKDVDDLPSVIQELVSDGGRGSERVMIHTELLPGTTTKAEQEKFFTSNGMKNSLPKEAKLLGINPTKIEGLPAGTLEYSMHQERAGVAIDIQFMSYFLVRGSTMIQLQCAVIGRSSPQDEVSRRMMVCKPLFSMIANSIVTTATEVPAGNPVSSSSWLPFGAPNLKSLILLCIVNIIATWILGLTPPLLIRYVFFRRPLNKKTASWIAAIFSAFFWIVSRALPEPDNGAAVVCILMFFVSRWILSRGYVPPVADSEDKV